MRSRVGAWLDARVALKRGKKRKGPEDRAAWLRENLGVRLREAGWGELEDLLSVREMEVLVDLVEPDGRTSVGSLGEAFEDPRFAGRLAALGVYKWRRLQAALSLADKKIRRRLVGGRPGDGGVPPPPAGASAVEAWLDRHGERSWLERPIEELRPFLDGTPYVHSFYRLPSGTVQDCLTGWGSGLRGHREPGRAELASAALRYLHFLADRRSLAARRAESWEKPLGSPRLEEAAGVLKRGLQTVLQHERARAPALFDRVDARITEEPAGVEIRFVGRRRAFTGDVTAWLSLEIDPGEPISWTCECRYADKEPCPHLRCALEWVLDWLYRADSSNHRLLAGVLEVPGWRWLVDRARGILSVPGEPDAERHLAWRLGEQEPGEGIELVPVLRTRKKNGRFGIGRVVRLSEVLESEGLLDDQDLRVASALALSPARRVYPRRGLHDPGWQDLPGEALLALAGHPRVFRLEAPAEPLSVERVTPAVGFREEAGGARAEVRLGDSTFDIGGIDSFLLHGRVLASLDPRRSRCLVAGLSRRAARLLSALAAHPAAVPPEGLDELIPVLTGAQPELELCLPDRLAGRRVEAESGCRLRLAPRGETGLDAWLVVRPAPGGPALTPGAGGRRLFLKVGGERIHLSRDLLKERRKAAETAGRLGLLVPGELLDWHWRIDDPDEALGLVAAAEELGDRLAVEWPGDAVPWRAVTVSLENVRVRVRRDRDWFRVEGEISLDGETVALADILDGLRRGERFVRLAPGRFARLSDELRRRFERLDRATFRHRRGLAAGAAGAREVSEALEGLDAEADGHWRDLLERLRRAARLRPRVPSRLRCELRRYQAEGYRWLVRLAAWAGGACLADDMGLGKTVQALALLLARSKRGPALAVAPTSVLSVWRGEAGRFAPELELKVYHGTGREGLLEDLGPGDLLLTSYDVAARDAGELSQIEFATLVLDEAQAVKNSRSRRAAAVRRIRAGFRLALTGTPLENHLGELWSVFWAVDPGLLGPWPRFRERFAAPIERDGDRRKLEELSAHLRPFLLRRTKAQVAPELPARTEVVWPVVLSEGERRLYRKVQRKAVEELAGGEAGRFAMLSAITRLRRLVCHPRLVDSESRLPSSKQDAALRVINGRLAQGERALVFSQFTSHLALIRAELDARGTEYLYLDGSTPAARRAELAERWASGRPDLFLISLKAGGFGMNLAGSDYVIHLDPWWNPAVEDQATDRTHRIGQTRPVTVVRLIAQETIEQAVLEMHAEKRALARGLLEGADQAARLSAEELMELIAYGAQS